MRVLPTMRRRAPSATAEHCANGHPWNEHTIRDGKTQRHCRYCQYLSSRQSQGFEDALDYDQWIAYRIRRQTQCKNGHLWAEHGRKTDKGWVCKKCQVDVRRRRVYGIEPEEYDTIVEKQDGKCAGCLVPLEELDPRSIHLDHDHGTGAVRGLLCHDCNISLGYSRDDPSTLRRLADYLEGTTPEG